MKWDDDRIDRDHVSLAKDHITEDYPLAKFLIEMKNKDTIDGHWRYFSSGWTMRRISSISIN